MLFWGTKPIETLPPSLLEGSAFGSSNACGGWDPRWWEWFHGGSGLRLFIPLHHLGFAWVLINDMTSCIYLFIYIYINSSKGQRVDLMMLVVWCTWSHCFLQAFLEQPIKRVFWDLGITSNWISYIYYTCMGIFLKLPHISFKNLISICM